MFSLRNEFGFLNRTADAVLVAPGTNEIRWFTFAGSILNLAIADTIRQHGYDDVRASDYWICVRETTDHARLFEKIDGFNVEAVRAGFRVPEEYLKQLKFSECMPQDCATQIVRDRLLQPVYLETILMAKRVFVC